MTVTCLLVITDGRPSLDRTLTSAAERVLLDRFTYSVMVDDSQSPEWATRLDDLYGDRFRIHHAPEKVGFAGAIHQGWTMVPGDAEFVFHLEDDWEFLRDVPVDVMTQTLRDQRNLAQMALVRNPVNRREIAGGGLLEANGGSSTFIQHTDGPRSWMEHDRWFTTNPCLYPTTILHRGWPSGPDSERKVTDRLRGDGLQFGYWGESTDGPWVQHTARRSPGWRA